MENLIPGTLIGLLFVLTNPAPAVATLLFKIGALSRIIHTFVYAVMPMPQPSRVLAFIVHYLIVIYMCVSLVMHLL